MHYRTRRRHSAGDTIVEVLIATVIVTTVLVGAFIVTQKSVQAVRDSEERSEVLQLLQGQVERVRALALKTTSSADPLFSTTPKYFCIDTTGDATDNQRVDFPGGAPNPISKATSADYTNSSKWNPKCAGLGNGKLYNIAVSYDTASHVFTFEGQWDNITGNTDHQQLSYRIYPGAAPPIAAGAPAAIGRGNGGGGLPGPLSLSAVTCESLIAYQGTPGFYYADVKDYPSGDPNDKSWHVAFHDPDPTKQLHSIATIPYNFSTPLTPGAYYMWAISKDNSYNSSGSNKRLHFIGYDQTDKQTFKTGDTPEIPKNKGPGDPPNPEAYWFSGVPIIITGSTKYMLDEHAKDNGISTDDSVDSDCFVAMKI